MITTQSTINLASQVAPPIIQAVQGDTGRAVSFALADYTVPEGATATYYIAKPSGEAVYNTATISGNNIICELTAQSLAELGENNMQVRIIKDEDIVTSFDVILLVRPFRGIDAIESDTEMNIFDKAVEKAAEDFQTQAEQIVEEVVESIPADYSELTEEVSELNERLDELWNPDDPITDKLDTVSDTVHMDAEFTETDPTVPAWAKAASKPSYSASEITSTDGTVQSDINSLNSSVDSKIGKTDNITTYMEPCEDDPELDIPPIDVSEQVEQTISETNILAETIVSHTDENSGEYTPTSGGGVTPELLSEIEQMKEDIDDLQDGKVPYPDVSPYGTSGQVLSSLGNGKTQWIAPVTPSSADVSSAMEAWLDEHPEATTTVLDHSLTHTKLVNGTLNFVTPEMFGAVGDGVTDDYTAIQAAISAGDYVLFAKKTYLVGTTLEIDHGDVVIDFNGADIICTANGFIKAESAFDVTLYTGAYTANTADGYDTGDGLVNITSQETAHYGRTYYYKGGCFYSNNGQLNGTLPYSITSCTIKGQTHPLRNITIKGVGSYENSNAVPYHSYAVLLDGVSDSIIDNCRFAPEDYNYDGVVITNCSNITVQNTVIELIDVTQINTYGIHYSNSSYTTIRKCRIYSEKWDCITTGGGGTSINSLIEDCILSVSPTAEPPRRSYDDHGNTLGVKISNCYITGNIAISDGSIENCVLMLRNSNGTFGINFQAWVGDIKPNLTIRNIKVHATTLGIGIGCDIQNGIDHEALLQFGTLRIENIVGNVQFFVSDKTFPSNIIGANYENLIIDGVKGSLLDLQCIKNVRVLNSEITSINLRSSHYDDLIDYVAKIYMTNCKSASITNRAFGIDLQADNCSFDNFFSYGSALPKSVQLSNCRNSSGSDVTIKAEDFFQMNGCVFNCSNLVLALSSGVVQAYNLLTTASGANAFPSDLYKADDATSYSVKTSPIGSWGTVNI